MQQYNYWGFGGNEPPPHLKTKKQLAQIGLSPLQPVGFIKTPKYTLYLYDPNNTTSVKPKRKCTPKQLETLQKGRELVRQKALYQKWYKYGGFIEEDRAAVVQCVQKFITDGNWVILDTETTGLDDDAEIVEITVINPQGETLLNTLVKPTIPSSIEATSIHEITNEMLSDAPEFPQIYPQLKEVLLDKTIAIYNDAFDKRIINYCCRLHKLPLLGLKDRTVCLMHWYACWCGEYSDYWEDYKWQPLCGGHRALNDCLQALKLLQEIASDNPVAQVPNFAI